MHDMERHEKKEVLLSFTAISKLATKEVICRISKSPCRLWPVIFVIMFKNST